MSLPPSLELIQPAPPLRTLPAPELTARVSPLVLLPNPFQPGARRGVRSTAAHLPTRSRQRTPPCCSAVCDRSGVQQRVRDRNAAVACQQSGHAGCGHHRQVGGGRSVGRRSAECRRGTTPLLRAFSHARRLWPESAPRLSVRASTVDSNSCRLCLLWIEHSMLAALCLCDCHTHSELARCTTPHPAKQLGTRPTAPRPATSQQHRSTAGVVTGWPHTT